MRIGAHHDAICPNIVTGSGLVLPWVDEIRYPGVFVIRNQRSKCSLPDYRYSEFYMFKFFVRQMQL